MTRFRIALFITIFFTIGFFGSANIAHATTVTFNPVNTTDTQVTICFTSDLGYVPVDTWWSVDQPITNSNPGPNGVTGPGLSGPSCSGNGTHAITLNLGALSAGTHELYIVVSGMTISNGGATVAMYSSAFSPISFTVTVPPVSGVCGSANGAHYTSVPTSGLCSSGTQSVVTTQSGVTSSGASYTYWSWTCAGSNGGSDASCATDPGVCLNGATDYPTCSTCASGQMMLYGRCSSVALSVDAFPTAYTVSGGSTNNFTFSVRSSPSAYASCGLLDNSQRALTGNWMFMVSGSISATVPSHSGAYGYYVYCMNGVKSSISAPITVTVPCNSFASDYPACVPPPSVAVAITPPTVTQGGYFTILMSSSNVSSCTWSRSSTYGGDWSNQPMGTSYNSGQISYAVGTSTWTFSCTNTTGQRATSAATEVVTAPASCALPWGGTISSGSSVPAYLSSLVPPRSPCSSQTRTCSNGTLSGSYQNQSCASGCTPPQVYNGSFCTDACTNGANNPPYCTVCPSGQLYDTPSNSCVTPGVPVIASPSAYSAQGGASLIFTYSVVSTPSGSYSCRLLDYQQNPLTSYVPGANAASYPVPAVSGSYAYYIGCENTVNTAITSVSNPITVTVLAQPAVTLTASPSILYGTGKSVTLSWYSSDATSCSGSGFSTGGAISGNTDITMNNVGSSTFTIVCTGPGGSATASKTVIVSDQPSATLTSSGSPIVQKGSAASLSWSILNMTANTCRVTGGGSSQSINNASNDSGTITTPPIEINTPFTLACTGLDGKTYSASFTVGLVPQTMEI